MVSFSGKDPLVRQLYEFDEQMEDLSQGVRPMSRALWKYRHHITVEELSSSFQKEVLSGGGGKFKVLDAFLKQVKSTYCCKELGFCATKKKSLSCNSNPFFCLNFGQHLFMKNRRESAF